MGKWDLPLFSIWKRCIRTPVDHDLMMIDYYDKFLDICIMSKMVLISNYQSGEDNECSNHNPTKR